MLAARDRWGWGPRKLHARPKAEGRAAPPVRTIAAIRRRPGRIRPAAAPAAVPPPRRFERGAPDALWQRDFKGPIEVERRRVAPLAILDDYGRHRLALRPGADRTHATGPAILRDPFGDVGLPAELLCAGAFAARDTAVGPSAVDAWLIRRGVRPAHGRADPPRVRGKIERFHGTPQRELGPVIRRDTTPPSAADRERGRPVYNTVRPHEALGDEPPVRRRRPSPRARPTAVPEVVDPADAGPRGAGQAGDIRYHRARVLIGVGLAGQRVRGIDSGPRTEASHGPYRARIIATALLTPHQRV